MVNKIEEIHRSNAIIGQIWQSVKEGVMPVDSGIGKSLYRSKESLIFFWDGSLYYVDPARKGRVRLVVRVTVSYKLIDEVH